MPVQPMTLRTATSWQMYDDEGNHAVNAAISQTNHLLHDGRAPLTVDEVVVELRAALERTCGEKHAEWRDTEPAWQLHDEVIRAAQDAGIAVPESVLDGRMF